MMNQELIILSVMEMEAECLTKTLPYLNLNISRIKNGWNKP